MSYRWTAVVHNVRIPFTFCYCTVLYLGQHMSDRR